MSRLQLSLNVTDLDATCYYARQEKVWARDPDGLAWEYYTVLEHTEIP